MPSREGTSRATVAVMVTESFSQRENKNTRGDYILVDNYRTFMRWRKGETASREEARGRVKW